MIKRNNSVGIRSKGIRQISYYIVTRIETGMIRWFSHMERLDVCRITAQLTKEILLPYTTLSD